VLSVDAALGSYGYPAIFAGMALEQFVPPMPGEPLLLAAGAVAGAGHLGLGWAVICALLGTLLGDILWYEIGRRGGRPVLRWLCRIAIEPDSCVRRGEEGFSRSGASVLLVAKFLPGLNSVGQPLAGALGMPRGRFLFFDALGAALWVGVYVGLGYAFHDQLARAVALAGRLGGMAVWLLAGLAALYLGVKVLRRRLFLRRLRIGRITPEELLRMLAAGEPVLIVDLRHELDVRADPTAIPGAIQMTPAELEQARPVLPRDRDVVLYCS